MLTLLQLALRLDSRLGLRTPLIRRQRLDWGLRLCRHDGLSGSRRLHRFTASPWGNGITCVYASHELNRDHLPLEHIDLGGR
ncbi:hypothetical protein K4L84_08670, partial [Pseudomonas syringae pv. tomato]|nr:hypothetical protein [Pseudomonas syringae pv. tomato]